MVQLQQFNTYKRAYYGYYLTSIRVDIYNKIIFKKFLHEHKNYNYDSYNLENTLKEQLKNAKNKTYFNNYFQYRKEIYNKFFTPYPYTVEETIDLIYQYRNFLLDDKTRLNKKKIPLILEKTLNQKEEDIQKIISLLLSEYLLEVYYNKLSDNKKLKSYQDYFFGQSKIVIKYRKLNQKNLGLSKYNLKTSYLYKYLNNEKIALHKMYKILTGIYGNLKLNPEEIKLIHELELMITRDYVKENFGLLRLKIKNKIIYFNLNQYLILYKFRKINADYNFFNLGKIMNNQEVLKTKKITKFLMKDLYHLKKRKYNDSYEILREFYKTKYKVTSQSFDQNLFQKKNITHTLLILDIINRIKLKKNIKYYIYQHLNYELKTTKKNEEQITGLINQLKFTMNLYDLKLIKIDAGITYELQKQHKRNKKDIVEDYIDTMYLLLKLRVHKYNKSSKYAKVYIYRNMIMHFQKIITEKQLNQKKIQEELKLLIKKNKLEKKIKIEFKENFFNLIQVKNLDLKNKNIKIKNKLY